jgi:hypothetical protein
MDKTQEIVVNDDYISNLRKLYDSFFNFTDFKKGQLVKWKSGMKNKNFPQENQPAIVIDLLDNPIYENNDSSSPYFKEPLDIALAMTDNEGDFIVFYYDKRRFELVEL